MLACEYALLNVDTCAMDNSDIIKDGVGRTHAGVNGYCPLAVYLGTYSVCLELALRSGTQHSTSETLYNLECVVPMAQRLSAADSKAPILARRDAGFCSAAATAVMADLKLCNAPGLPQVDWLVNWLVKWNPCRIDPQALLRLRATDPATQWFHPRDGE
ncbi:transposase IS4 family protein [mine drainage metagenome]|uniref:Transposase IS4 family protein n=1 Tax=mine drainage metagenome TaxID=410659 RepID=T0ZVG9_9ZZZZ